MKESLVMLYVIGNLHFSVKSDKSAILTVAVRCLTGS